MIEIFEGRLGGGKTYSAVERILLALSRGQTVYSNIKLYHGNIALYLEAVYGVELQPGQLNTLTYEEIPTFHKFCKWGTPDCPTLLVVDEVHIWFNARDWANAMREVLDFLTQSRKACLDIIFISQSADNIDKQFRRLIQYIWRFRDMSKFQVPALGIRWPLNQILQLGYDGQDGRTKQFQRWAFKDKKIFSCYETLSFLSPIEEQERLPKRPMKRVTPWRQMKARWELSKGGIKK